ncbi:MAG: hypothetical protein ACK40G_00495 [Cytophagaceae bacterium]
MAFSIVAEGKNVDWIDVRNEIFKSRLEYINVYPILSEQGIVSIAVSIPIFKLDEYCWEELNFILFTLRNKFSLKLFELYNGEQIPADNTESLKELIGFKF